MLVSGIALLNILHNYPTYLTSFKGAAGTLLMVNMGRDAELNQISCFLCLLYLLCSLPLSGTSHG